jgi:hypothetical protein
MECALATEALMVSFPHRATNRSLVVECVDRSHATMYLDRPLTTQDADELRQLTQVLPLPVRSLRVQVRAVDANQQTMNALRDVVRAWRSRGNVHLVFVGGLATISSEAPAELPYEDAHAEWGSPAHTAAFL